MYEYEYIKTDNTFPHRCKSIDDCNVNQIYAWIEKYIKKYDLITDLYDEKLNLRDVPVNGYTLNANNAQMFNELYEYCKEYVPMTIRTKSGGISINKKNQNWQNNICSWFFRRTKSMFEIFFACVYVFRIQIGTHKDENTGENVLSGTMAFNEFKNICHKHGVDINNYQISKEDGEKAKSEIEKPLICWGDFGASIKDIELNQVNHIDFHSAYMSGLMSTHPEFSSTAKELYHNRKEKPIYKSVMTNTIGYMQSIDCCGAKWAHLSRDAINYNYHRMLETAENMRKKGFIPLLFNTDGIWYVDSNGNSLYHDEHEGNDLCQWSHDYVNVTFRAKSHGAYEIIYKDKDGNDVYKPVLRGYTELDKIKDRKDWVWGDIYQDKAKTIKFVYDYEKGIIEKEIELYDFISEIR